MGAEKIAPLLREYASKVPNCRSIVEVGAWLGSGTRHLAEASNCEIFVYDRFLASDSEVEKAEAFGFKISKGQNTLPLVKEYLEPYLDRVRLKKCNIRHCGYAGPKIGLYVDDASKRLWPTVQAGFAPYFDSETILVMMDYHYPPCQVIRDSMSRHECVMERTPDTSTAVFRWIP